MEFLEDGGVLTLLDILRRTQSKEQDKAEALRLLLAVSNAGRKYKEIICESHGKFHKKLGTYHTIYLWCPVQYTYGVASYDNVRAYRSAAF